MRRRLFNIIAMISALMLGVVVLFWVRSYLPNGDTARWYRQPKIFEFFSHDGILWITGGTLVSDRYKVPGGWEGSFWPLQQTWYPSLGDLEAHTYWGFKLDRWKRSQPGLHGDSLDLVMPYWFLATLSAILPLIAFRRWIRSRHHDPSACPTCGYDLRATPDRCPECGAVASQKLV